MRNRNAYARGGLRDATLGLSDIKTSPQQIDRPAGRNPPRQSRNAAGFASSLARSSGYVPSRTAMALRLASICASSPPPGPEKSPSGQRNVQFVGDPPVEDGLRHRFGSVFGQSRFGLHHLRRGGKTEPRLSNQRVLSLSFPLPPWSSMPSMSRMCPAARPMWAIGIAGTIAPLRAAGRELHSAQGLA